jgi:hypothetical protein
MINNKQLIDNYINLNRFKLDSNKSITINKKIGRWAEALVFEISKINDKEQSHLKAIRIFLTVQTISSNAKKMIVS